MSTLHFKLLYFEFYYSNKAGTIDSASNIAMIAFNRLIPMSLSINFFKTTPPPAQEFTKTNMVRKNIIIMTIIWVVAFSADVTYTDIAVIILIQFFGLIHWNNTIDINSNGCDMGVWSVNKKLRKEKGKRLLSSFL